MTNVSFPFLHPSCLVGRWRWQLSSLHSKHTWVAAAGADTVSKDHCCQDPHQSLRLISLLPRVYVMPKGKRATGKAGAFDKTKDWSVWLCFFFLSTSFFLFLLLYCLTSLFSGAQWFNVPSLMAIQPKDFKSYTTILRLYLWNGQEEKKQRLLTRDLVRNIVPNWRPALMN